jgi:hypothetical protein
VLELFICKTEIKICFERWLFMSKTGNGVLVIFHTKQVESGSEFFEKLAHWCSFIKLGTPPHFSFHKPWLTDSIGCPPTFTYHGGVPFFLFYLDYNGLTSSLAKLMTSR